MKEIWREIKDYENLYEVSDSGKIRSIRNNIILSQYQKIDYTRNPENRYLRVTLANNGVYKRFFVHRLVGMAFISNPENKPQINHKNNIKSDNRAENLEWVNQSENTQHAFDNGYRDRICRHNYKKISPVSTPITLKLDFR